MPLSKKTTIISLILITLIGLGVLGYSFWLTTEQNKELRWNIQVNLKHSSANEPRDIQVLTPPADTSDWLTYRNEKYGYEIKYPRTWKLTVENHPDTPVAQLDDTVALQYFEGKEQVGSLVISKTHDNPENLSIFDWWARNGWPAANYKIQIGNIIGATRDKIKSKTYNGFVSINFTKDGKIFGIEWLDTNYHNDYDLRPDSLENVDQKYIEAYRESIQIISTFKFYR